MKLGISAVMRNCAALVFAGALLSSALPLQAQSIFGTKSLTGKPAPQAEAPIKPEGKATTETEIVDGRNQNAMLVSNGDALLQAAGARYQAIIDQGGFPKVSGNNYKKGDKGPGVAVLNRRLYIEGYLRVEGTQGQFADIFTTATQDALARFQRNHGLAVTGKTDAATIAELNVPAERRLATINANIPRLAEYEQGLGDRYLVVNIPAQQLEAVSGGRVFERHNVIVGRPARPSPVVMTPLATVKFNPYWNAPISIVEKDIIPKLDSKFTYLVEHDIKILRGGQNGEEVDPHTIDFKTANLEELLFRQEPGPENAMATAKIEFNSPFGIYLHDTPEKQMFAYNNRFFSSGCIRVQNMPQLVNWVLNGQDGYDPGRISDMAQTLERLDVPLQSPPQLRVAYLTAWPAANGTVAFRNDAYELDGTGFVVGQPMPVGQMSPDGKRFVLKPLPRALSVDEAEAEGSGFFGAKGAKAAKGAKGAKGAAPSLFSNTAAASGNTNSKSNSAKPMLANNSQNAAQASGSVKSKGLFDWDAYRKQQAQGQKDKPKATDTATTKKAVKKVAKKINCNSSADGSKPECNPPGAIPKAAGDTAKKP